MLLKLKKIIFLTALIAFSFVYLPAKEVAEADNVKVPINLNNKLKSINPNVKRLNNLKVNKQSNAENDKEGEGEEEKKDENKPTENTAQPKQNNNNNNSNNNNNEVRTVTPPQPKTILNKDQNNKAPEENKLLDAVKVEINEPKAANMDLKIRLDFKDEELMNVVKLFSDLLQKNFIIPENLGKAKVNLLSPQKVTVREAYKTFLTLLAVNDFSVSEDGSYTIITKEKNIPEMKIPFYKGTEVPDLFKMVATIMKFEYVTATDIDKVLKLFRDKGATSVVFDDKTLIVVDYAVNIRKIMTLVKELDQPSESDKAELYFIKLNHVLAADARKIIEDIFKDFSKKGNKKGKNNENTPSLGGVGKQGDSNNSKMPPRPPFPPSWANNQEDAEGLSETYIHIVADERSQQIIVLCNKATYNLILQVVQNIDREVEGEGEIHVVKLQNAKAEDMLKTLNSLSKNKKSSGSSKSGTKGTDVFEGDVQISANESTNSLVVVSSLQDFRNLKKVVEKLDVKRKQVFVEAAILEVSIDNGLEYGNAYSAMGYQVTVAGEKVPLFFGKALSSPTPGLVAGMVGASVDGTAGLPGLSLVDGIPSIGLILNAAQNDSTVNVVSTPHLLTTDNEEAEITVGETVPFPSGNILTSTTGSTITYTREDVALKLKIKPQINESGYMTLEINQEMTELGAQTDYGYKTTKRQAKTKINAENEQTIVIGGLMKDTVTEGENKIPILGDIPVIGNLFKYKKINKTKVNLLLILTPHVVDSKEDFERILRKKMEEREEFARKYYGGDTTFEETVYLDKRRGPLLSMVNAVSHQQAFEKEELKRIEAANKKENSIMVTPDGEEKLIENSDEPSKKSKSKDAEDELVPDIDEED
ncbi:type II secretion system secretin GspD [bacterium]|nr:type II secretion system secretin GspD [bacterium]